LAVLSSLLKSRAALQLGNVALRHQIGVLQRSAKKRLLLNNSDRLFVDWAFSGLGGVALCAGESSSPTRCLPGIAKHFACSGPGRSGEASPGVSPEIRELIRRMSRENPRWGAPRIHGELLKLGIDIGETSVSKYLVRSPKPPSQTWRTFLENRLQSLVSVDFFTVPTIRFEVLYVFLVLAHERRRIVHFAVTAHPTAEWTAHQLREAFPWESAPRYLLRDRDRIFGHDFAKQVKTMGIEQVLSAPRSPWQRAYIERVIGSIRRECLDHFIVFNERSLKHHLQAYCAYYHRTRTHLALQKDCPEPRDVQPPGAGPIISIPEAGGLHHRYERRVA
jgi:putative transposase